MTRDNLLYLVIGALVVAVAVLGHQLDMNGTIRNSMVPFSSRRCGVSSAVLTVQPSRECEEAALHPNISPSTWT